MILNLSDDDARTLRELLDSALPGLRWEIARTDHPDELRHRLARRLELVERLLATLETGVRGA